MGGGTKDGRQGGRGKEGRGSELTCSFRSFLPLISSLLLGGFGYDRVYEMFVSFLLLFPSCLDSLDELWQEKMPLQEPKTKLTFDLPPFLLLPSLFLSLPSRLPPSSSLLLTTPHSNSTLRLTTPWFSIPQDLQDCCCDATSFGCVAERDSDPQGRWFRQTSEDESAREGGSEG